MENAATSEIRLEHAFLFVEDLARSLAFYAKVFPDWTVRWDGRQTGGGQWVHFGPEGEGQPGYLSLCSGKPSPNGEHIGFSHPDVNALVSRLATAGVKPTDRVDDGKFRRIYLEDPDGHELEFVQKL